MKFIQNKLSKKLIVKALETKYIFLSVVLFVLLPFLIFFSPVIFSILGMKGCLISLFFLCFVHIGLPIVVALARYLPWKMVFISTIVFVAFEYFCYSYYSKYFYNFSYWLWLSATLNASNSLYIFGVKGIFETLQRRKTRSFWWAIFLTSPLLVVLGLTIFAGFFFVVNCF